MFQFDSRKPLDDILVYDRVKLKTLQSILVNPEKFYVNSP